jgi:2'-5' RNA ligase
MHDTTTTAAARQRLFLALWPGVATRAALVRCRDAIAPEGAAPTADARLHLTLHFIGDVDAQRVPDLQRALRVPMHRFELVLDRVSRWPGGALVLESGAPAVALLELHEALRDALLAAGVPVERRPFRPHVTLARHAPPGEPAAPVPALRWPVSTYVLVRSQLGPSPRYCRLCRYG